VRNGRVRILAGCWPLILAGCATTTFTSTWQAPDAQPLQFEAGSKVVALLIAERPSLRRSGETSLAAMLDRHGLAGVPAYTLLPEGAVKNEERAKRAIDQSGAVGVIVLRPMGKEKEVSVTPATWVGRPDYRGFWGGGFYGYGWRGAWRGPQVRTDTYVHIETLLYDLRRNELVWAGQSKTMNPRDVESFVADLARAVGEELAAAGLIGAE
jgi:hypothetical protein